MKYKPVTKDYTICFKVTKEQRKKIRTLATKFGTSVTGLIIKSLIHLTGVEL